MKRLILSLSLIAIGIQADTDLAVTTSDVEAEYTNKRVEVSQKTKELKHDIGVGFANTSGNTETTNLNAKYTFQNVVNVGSHKGIKYLFGLSGFLNKEGSTTLTEEYTAVLGVETLFGDKWLTYTSVDWLQNKLQNFDHKVGLGIGVGKTLYKNDHHKLLLKLGTAYNMEYYTNDQSDHRYASLNEYLEYAYLINETSKFYAKLGAQENYEDFTNDYEATVLTGVDVEMMERLHLTLEQEFRYDHLPAIGFNKTDNKTIINLGYKF